MSSGEGATAARHSSSAMQLQAGQHRFPVAQSPPELALKLEEDRGGTARGTPEKVRPAASALTRQATTNYTADVRGNAFAPNPEPRQYTRQYIKPVGVDPTEMRARAQWATRQVLAALQDIYGLGMDYQAGLDRLFADMDEGFYGNV